MGIKEVERKFIVKKIHPAYLKNNSVHLDQGYITSSSHGSEVRIRRENNTAYLTVKSAGDMVRQERTIRLTKDQSRVLWPLTKGRRIQKARYRIRIGRRIAFIDIYMGALKGLKIVEFEFKSVGEAKKFTPSSWLTKELTCDTRYKNRNLATKGRPKDRW